MPGTGTCPYRSQLVAILGGNLVDEWRDHAARTAPWRPKIYQHRHRALEHQLIKGSIRDHASSCEGGVHATAARDVYLYACEHTWYTNKAGMRNAVTRWLFREQRHAEIRCQRALMHAPQPPDE